MRGVAQYLVSNDTSFSVPIPFRRTVMKKSDLYKPVVSSPLSQIFSSEEIPRKPTPTQKTYARLHELLYTSVCNNFPEYKDEVLKLPESWKNTPMTAAQAWRKYMEQTAPELLVGSSEDHAANHEPLQDVAMESIDQSPSDDYKDNETVERVVISKKRKFVHEDDSDPDNINISTNF
jgi:hypothetical protein